MTRAGHAWLPETSCTEECVHSLLGEPNHRARATVLAVTRITATVLILMTLPLLALPLPGHLHAKRFFCRAVLRCLGIRLIVSGGPIRNLQGMLVVSNHVSWVDVFAIGAVLPGSFVARADLIDWPAVGLAARMANVIPIERRSLRKLPTVVHAVVERLRKGYTVIAFPEGTTYCGQDHGRFRPALFQAAIDAARPVQPLRLTYHHRDGTPSTATAFLGEDSLWASVKRIVGVRQTVVQIRVRPLELPNSSRSQLSARCQAAVQAQASPHPATRKRTTEARS
jgi:1-acyl-sn-glycerol-3-phosphate acyltransferase